MEKLINKLEQNTYQNFTVIDNTEIKLENKNTFSKAQQGYRKNGNKLIPEWDEFVGEDFYIIGFSTAVGDPIITNIKNPSFPVYYIFNENWNITPLLANSFDEFIENLKQLDQLINVDFADRSTIRKFAKSLDKKYSTMGFYQALCFEVIDKDGTYYKNFKAYSK